MRMPVTIDDVLHPVTPAAFLESYYEKRPLLIQRGSPGYYDPVITLDRVDTLIGEASLSAPGVRLVRDGEEVDRSAFCYSGALVHKERVFGRFYDGHTIVLNDYHLHCSRMLYLCQTIERMFHAGVRANVYITPRSSRGFRAHWDTHDVFVLQFAGTKEWLLYDTPVTLPSKRTGFTYDMWQPVEPTMRIVLGPGDVLYIPRGTVHEARAQTDVSGHATLGVYPATYADVLLRLLAETDGDAWLRRSLPADFGTSDAWVPEFVRRVQEFVAGADVRSIASTMSDEITDARLPDATGRLNDYLRLPSLGWTTRLRRRANIDSRMTANNGTVVLAFHNKTVPFPAGDAERLRFIAAQTDEFTARALPGETDDESRLDLCRTLVREGLLSILE